MARNFLADQELTGTTHERIQLMLKRVLDILGAGILILLLSPLFVVLGLPVALEDGWPVVYRRRVIGTKGEFDAYKFRSMCKNADSILAANPAMKQEYELNFKLADDPRVTRVGSVLRKLSLDELPQLFNVLKGDMSLVGPRMISPAELKKYGPHKQQLLTMKPGLTGYWQVNGRQTVGYDERVRMDLHYIGNWSLVLDFEILLKTPYAILKREGAY
jgi:lipopolysaccharide/colanic/teichoic acid biosynthesis glycosyltransferase